MASADQGSNSKQELTNMFEMENKILKLQSDILMLEKKLDNEMLKEQMCSTCMEKQEKILEELTKDLEVEDEKLMLENKLLNKMLKERVCFTCIERQETIIEMLTKEMKIEDEKSSSSAEVNKKAHDDEE